MTALVMALYAEGPTDEHFLPIIAQRTAVQILGQRGRGGIVDVLDPMCISAYQGNTRAERILHAAKQTHGYHLLIVHADANQATPQAAFQERIQPGLDLVKRESPHTVCRELVPIIPVKMTEAWMLADADTLISVIGTLAPRQSLGIPTRPRQVEAIMDPKQQLSHVLQQALASRTRRYRRRRHIGELYEPLARQMSLQRLEQVPAYQQFVDNLSQALTRLNFVR